jgi:hypothetical protein
MLFGSCCSQSIPASNDGRLWTVVLSYCKLRSCATKYRKTTRFLSSILSSATYAAPCSPSAPCAMVRNEGKHEQVIGERERGRARPGLLRTLARPGLDHS